MSFPETNLSKAWNLEFPLIVAPMAGGPSSPELVIAASEAGALGSIGAAYLAPPAIAEFFAKVRAGTKRPFSVNLFVPDPEPAVSEMQLTRATEKTRAFREELGIPSVSVKPPYAEDFDRQFEAVLRERPPVLSFVFGKLSDEHVRAARAEKIALVGTATSPDEASALEETGVDAIVLQGIEAGGHRGLFDPQAADPEIPLAELLRAARVRVKVPLIAAGGIMTAADVRSALEAGAEAVQMGTAFLAVEEAGTSAPYRRKLLEAPARETKTTRAFSGRLARGIVNRFMCELDSSPEAILPFPAQNKFTRDLRTASAAAGSPDFLSLWSGTGRGELWTGSAADLIRALFPD